MSDLTNIFDEANDEGLISDVVKKDMLNLNFDIDILDGAQDIDEIESTDVVLITLLMDDSGSMTPLVREALAGQNEMIDALRKTKNPDDVLIGQWSLNSSLYHSYVPLKDSAKLTTADFVPHSMTPLYDRWYEALTANVAYAQQLRSAGTPVRSIAVVLTDGYDNDSHKVRASECKKLAKDLLDSEQFVLAFIGVGNEADFKSIAKEMGFPEGSVLLAGATPSEMRRAFQMLSQSVVRASQSAISTNVQNSFFS